MTEGQRCYVPGTHTWMNVRATVQQVTGIYVYVDKLCASARANDNLVNGSSCAQNSSDHRSCLTGSLPVSSAYGLFEGKRRVSGVMGGNSTLDQMNVAAATPADTVGVCGR